MATAPAELSLPRPSCPGWSSSSESRFSNLRGVRWRIDLGVLPCSPTASIDDLRRIAADSRRRYASLRRRLLVDPHLSKDGNVSPNLVMDNPLSQNPDSMWGRFFRNAGLEKMVDEDLSRLYPGHGSYFQTSACQAMLRRILSLWCIRHPEYGYRQGMHELLAPLLYVLQVDVQHLSEVQSLYEDYFSDDFDAVSFPEGDPVSNYRFTKVKTWVAEVTEEESSNQGSTASFNSLDDLDPETRDIFLLSDPYGAEGELGIILSERFMEHDAYCMFDNLMNGARGVVAMVDFFSPSPAFGSSSGLPPVIEASTSLYHLLSIVDPSLHSHLIELAVEPQYFALRWLRVLFGREFALEILLVVWDEIFSSPNGKAIVNDSEYRFRVLCSPRGAFISAMAVSMLLHLRSSLLSSEYATACLQRLLNFPQNINVKKLIEKAKSLQAIALESNISSSETQESSNRNKPTVMRGSSLSSGSVSPKTPLHQFPDSYWEEKWRELHNEEAIQNGTCSDSVSSGTRKGSVRGRFSLFRTESDPSPSRAEGAKATHPSVRRNLLDDLSQGTSSKTDPCKLECDTSVIFSGCEDPVSLKLDVERHFLEGAEEHNIIQRTSDCIEESCLSGENSSVLSTATSPHSLGNDHDNHSEKSSVSSNSFVADNDESTEHVDDSCSSVSSDKALSQHSEFPSAATSNLGASTDKEAKQAAALEERKPPSGKFQWFWKFGRGPGERSLDKCSTAGDISKATSSSSTYDSCGISNRTEVGDKKVTGTFKNLGQSMIENIQVLELVLQQERVQSGSLENLSNNILGSKGQAKAVAALKELRKISNLLSEM